MRLRPAAVGQFDPLGDFTRAGTQRTAGMRKEQSLPDSLASGSNRPEAVFTGALVIGFA